MFYFFYLSHIYEARKNLNDLQVLSFVWPIIDELIFSLSFKIIMGI